MSKITGQDISPEITILILDFLNNAKNPQDFGSPIYLSKYFPNGYSGLIIPMELAERIIEIRAMIGSYTNLKQLNEVEGFDNGKLEELVGLFEAQEVSTSLELYEPLFRFASLRYHDKSIIATRKKRGKNKEDDTIHQIQFSKAERRLSIKELADLERAHVAALARKEITFLGDLLRKLDKLYLGYNKEKEAFLKKEMQAHTILIENNIKEYEASLGKEEKNGLEEKKNAEKERYQTESIQTESLTDTVYPPYLFPPFNFEFMGFASSEFLKEKLDDTELGYIDQNELLDTDYIFLQRKLNGIIKEKQYVASFSNLKWKKNIIANGNPIALKNRYKNGYALSLDVERDMLYLSVVVPEAKSFVEKAEVSLFIYNKWIKSKAFNLIGNEGRLLFLENEFANIPKLDRANSIQYRIRIELNTGDSIVIEKTVSGKNDLWVGQFNSETHKNEKNTQAGRNIKDMNGILKLGWADLMRVEQKLCCYVPGEISHIENIMAREYKEKSTEFLERSENSYTQENETETIEKNDTTSVEKNDWNKEVSKTLERNFDFGLGTTVSYGSKEGPWYASINADMSISNSQSQSSKNSQSFSKEVTDSASESIRNRSFEKRTATLIKQFKETNKHGFDNRGGDSHVSGVFRWVDKVYENRIINYGKGMLYEFMIPKPSELYVETLPGNREDDTDGPDLPDKPDHPGLKSWNDIKRDTYMNYINKYKVSDYEEPKADTLYDTMEIGMINDAFDWAKENKNEVTRTYQFGTILAPDYYLEAVIPTSQSNKTDWKIRVHNPFWKPYAKFQVTLKNSSGQVRIVDDRSFASRIVHEEDVAGNVDDKQGLGFETAVDVHLYGSHVRWLYHLDLNFRFKLKPTSFVQWQKDTYNAIMRAYQDELDAYDAALAASQLAGGTGDTDASLYDPNQYKNPGQYKEIINTELKRLCIEMLLQHTSVSRCQEFYSTSKCSDDKDCESVPVLSNMNNLDTYSSFVKFLEQSFFWSLSSYNMYPYYWAGQCDWADMLHNEDTPDNEFQKFLKSGMARVLVPVREGFEKAVAYYIATGTPWFDGEPPQIDDPLYVSVVNELNDPVGDPVGDPWKTSVPSSLTLIQGDTVYLKNQGLPCCDDMQGHTGILPSDNKLEAKDDDSGE